MEGTRKRVGLCSTACGWERNQQRLMRSPSDVTNCSTAFVSFFLDIYASHNFPFSPSLSLSFSTLYCFWFFTWTLGLTFLPSSPYTPISFPLHGHCWSSQMPVSSKKFLSFSLRVVVSILCKMQIVLRLL